MRKRIGLGPCEVETPEGWVPGEVVGYAPGDNGEDFVRVSVSVGTRLYRGCHPNHVRVRTEGG